ncbi:hypothetical protein WJX81_003519 [Elliptochloris bilobata]|uniref:Ribonuclease n=1 Tax=Elliptochloris bilobata TaxID=381761 RepID=A0AAW1R0S1_9CHLO
MASTGWCYATVKDVVGADTVVVVAASKNASVPPPEKRITLSSLIAPRLGRRDGTTEDEPFAYAAKDFLRKRAIGKPCTFKIDYKLDSVPGREFGSVFLTPQNENLALSVVAAGWAKVRVSGEGLARSPYYAELEASQQAAEAKGLGLWTKDAEALAKAKREPPQEFSAEALLQSAGKGKPLPALVTAVANGSTLRVSLLPHLTPVTVLVVGTQAPSMAPRPAPAAANGSSAEAPAANGGGAEAANGAPAAAPAADPMAALARHFTEMRVLGREVRVVLAGVDKFDNLFGSVVYADAEERPVDLGEQLLRAGLARCPEWSVAMLATNEAFKLRNAERAAKQAKAGLWRNYVPPASAGARLSDRFQGPVVEVVSGDCLVVLDSASGLERRVMLSSIKAPRLPRRAAPAAAARQRGVEEINTGETWAPEAKEFLRSRLIGREVSVVMEYTRKVGGAPGPESLPGAGPERTLVFGAVFLPRADGKDSGDKGAPAQDNVAKMLLIRGLATAAKHRSDDERSAHYEELLEAEQEAIKGKKALHGARQPPPNNVRQLSAKAASDYLPFVRSDRHKGPVTAVVDFVIAGHRLKVVLKRDPVQLPFALAGVRTPLRAQQASAGRPATQDEPHCHEALALTRRLVLQREVELDVEAVDRGGTFLGSLRTTGAKPINLGLALLEAGLAQLSERFDPERTAGGREMVAAQERARAARLKIWESYVPPKPAEEGAANGNGNAMAPGEAAEPVVISYARAAEDFFVQMGGGERLGYIAEQLAALDDEEGGAPPPALCVGDRCVAKFSADGQWYRAQVEALGKGEPGRPSYEVAFIDWGNTETVPAASVRAMSPALKAVDPQAAPASLAFLKIACDPELSVAAARMLAAEADKPGLTARRMGADPFSMRWAPRKLALLLQPVGQAGAFESVNARLLAAGLARLAPPRGRAAAADGVAEVLEALGEAESEARAAHAGMFEYGDPGSEDEEEAAPRPKGAWGRK